MSLDEGETWNMAQLPSVGQEQFYSILAANDDMVFMHVDEPGGEREYKVGDVSFSISKFCLIMVTELHFKRKMVL